MKITQQSKHQNSVTNDDWNINYTITATGGWIMMTFLMHYRNMWRTDGRTDNWISISLLC